MVTYRHGAALLVLGGLFGTACGSLARVRQDGAPADKNGGGDPAVISVRVPGGYAPGASVPQAAYPGTGFVVHEWGTNTFVVGTDGAALRGLHHEEEDLPGFVYDRIKAGGATGSVEAKMETPVLYFYADAPRDVQVAVTFPAGVMTQWYPSARGFAPMIASLGGVLADPVLDPRASLQLDVCKQRFADGKEIKNGYLDWGSVHVGARFGKVALPDAPLAEFSWGQARAVASNPVRVDTPSGGHEDEQFLFYRGLGNFTMPVRIEGAGSRGVTLTDLDPQQPVGAVFVLDVGPETARFVVHGEGLSAARGPLAVSLDGAPAQPLDAYADALANAMITELDRTGLYHDESAAMVATWKRQWFRTPGLRVLYLAPQAWTEAQIPLALTPMPDLLTRVMVIRTEVLTKALEDSDTAAVRAMLAGSDGVAAGTTHFTALGRFAEPRLRRARQLAGDPSGSPAQALLDRIAEANTTQGIGE
jgi:hypothetical protein